MDIAIDLILLILAAVNGAYFVYGMRAGWRALPILSAAACGACIACLVVDLALWLRAAS